MTTLYKRPGSPYWYYDIADPAAPSGRRRVSTRRVKKAEAVLVADAARREALNRVQLGALEEITLEEALSRYAASVSRKASAGNIQYLIDKALGRLTTQPGRYALNPTLPFHELSLRHIRRLREAREAEGNAPQTINHEVKTLAAAYNFVRKEGVRVPAVIEFPKAKVAGKLRWFTREEADRLLRELDPRKEFYWKAGKNKGARATLNPMARRQRQDAYDLVVFLLDTGCRYSEVGEITWAAIDTREWRWVDIYRSKTSSSDLLTMTERLRAVLRRRYEGRGNSAYVFPGYGPEGAATPRGKSTAAIRRAIERAGLNAPELVKRYGRATTHTLRDTFASWLVQEGVSLAKVQRLLGHTTPMMTQKYAKLEPGRVADEAAAVLDKLASHSSTPSPNEAWGKPAMP